MSKISKWLEDRKRKKIIYKLYGDIYRLELPPEILNPGPPPEGPNAIERELQEEMAKHW